MDSRDKLIEHNLRLVAHIVKKYSAQGETDDLISIGTIGPVSYTHLDVYKRQGGAFASSTPQQAGIFILYFNSRYCAVTVFKKLIPPLPSARE